MPCKRDLNTDTYYVVVADCKPDSMADACCRTEVTGCRSAAEVRAGGARYAGKLRGCRAKAERKQNPQRSCIRAVVEAGRRPDGKIAPRLLFLTKLSVRDSGPAAGRTKPQGNS